MNFIQQGIQNVIGWAFGIQSRDSYDEASGARMKALASLVSYYDGKQRRPLRVSGLGKDYNVITNMVKTIVDRSVSMLMGAGVEFDLPGEGESEQDAIINRVWDANRKDILLHDVAQFGSIYGTPAIKIIPDGRQGIDGKVTHRLVALNPFNLTVYSAPDDIENVTAYVYRWNQGDTAWRELTEKQENGQWIVKVQKLDKSTGSQWQDESETLWDYDFPPITHGKNLPNAGNLYGYSDIEGIIDLQDKYNEAQSNVNKILSLQAWAQKYIIGGKFPRTKDGAGGEYLDVGPDKALEISNENAKVGILQPSGDLASSRQFANDIRRDIFDISGCVDSETVKDKVGALTNFGLRVLFKNELAKNATKQLLYGDLLLNVNNRLLKLSGFDGADADPGKVVFGDPLPVDDREEIATVKEEIALGLLSLETGAKRRNIDWEIEQERKAKEKAESATLGGDMIRNFLAGK